MSGRKIDFFGTFLDNLKPPSSAAAGAGIRGPRLFSPSLSSAAPGPDPLNEVLKALRHGDRPAKDLIPLVGRSVSEFLAIGDRLVELGWVRRVDGDVLQLTEKGHEVADLLE
jgi:hypothetical protein